MSSRIQLELSGKYSAAPTFKTLDSDVKNAQKRCKDFADAGRNVLSELSGVFSGQLNGAISSTVDLLGEITRGGIWGIVGAVAAQAIGFVVKKFTEAREAAEKVKKEYDEAAKKIGTASEIIGGKGADALAVKVKLAREAIGVAHLPRVAFVGDVVLREPTIGHELWIERVAEYVDMGHGRNFDFVHAFALSMDQDKLPNPLSRVWTIHRIFKFARKRLSTFTESQLSDALVYVMFGADWKIGEMPPAKGDGEKREKQSAAIGVMIDAHAHGIGLSTDDAKRMTASEIMETVARAEIVAKNFGSDYEYNHAMGDYVRARNEVMERATKAARP